MAGNDATAKFFGAMNEGYDAFIDTIRAANDRGHRMSTALIEDVQRGQREAVELATKWAEAPFDLASLSSSIADASTKAQNRSLEVTRQLFGEMAEAQDESREVFQRVVNANRSAGEAAVGVARGFFTRASEAVQSATQSTPTTGGDGRRTARESSRTSQAANDESSSDDDS
jgi:phage-related tail protein